MPSSLFRTTSDGTPRIVEVTGATVAVDKYARALSRVSTRTGRFLSGAATGRAEPHLALFFLWLVLRPRRLRFPIPRFRVGWRLLRVALPVPLFTDAQFQPTEMFPQGIAHQSGTVSPGELRQLGRLPVTISCPARSARFPYVDLIPQILHTRGVSKKGLNSGRLVDKLH